MFRSENISFETGAYVILGIIVLITISLILIFSEFDKYLKRRQAKRDAMLRLWLDGSYEVLINRLQNIFFGSTRIIIFNSNLVGINIKLALKLFSPYLVGQLIESILWNETRDTSDKEIVNNTAKSLVDVLGILSAEDFIEKLEWKRHPKVRDYLLDIIKPEADELKRHNQLANAKQIEDDGLRACGIKVI